ncbi:MAG TPA: hydrogenase iron-sulfur subunit [Anaerolineae bacterium]|nr:hydrogenase iron-sulfur subunit [Anaerolineae bacterium]
MAVDEIDLATEFEPKVVAFMCNWCTYAGADNAGVARIESPANILPIRVMCSGRISPEIVLRTFREGADGVLVMGCHLGDCHYSSGNHRTLKRVPLLRNLLGYAGINPQRLQLEWVSAAEGPRFARVTRAFVDKIRELGPLSQEVSA